MNRSVLTTLLSDIPNSRVGILGDACVDIYWDADMRKSELSRETPQYPYPVVSERCSLGAGANVAANLSAAGCRNIRFIGLIGSDWRGAILQKLFHEQGIDDRYLIESEKIVTPAYCKPMLHGISDVVYEAPRLDFVNNAPIPESLENAVLENLKEAVRDIDVLIVCDQMRNGAVSQRAITLLSELGKTLPIVADSRDRLNDYHGIIIKPNEHEAARALGLPPLNNRNLPAVFAAAQSLERRTGAPVLITLGDNGAVWCQNSLCTHVPSCPVPPPIDFVGAGDSFLAGFALSLSCHIAPADCLSFACLMSAVTIRKLGITGTASPQELSEAFDLYHRP